MRNERKYKIITLLTALLSLLLLGTCFREPYRIEAAEAKQHEEYVLKGAKVYAQNCVQCHGPHGEGVVGMPLNRKVNKVSPDTPAGKEIYNKIFNTVRMGRKANDAHPQWVKAPDNKWISYTTMPAWGKDYGGPLDDDYAKAVTEFIMNEDGTQWNLPGTEVAPFQLPDLKPDPKTGKIPLPDAETDAATNSAAQDLIRGKATCLACHTIGSKGSKIGPDLSHVGSWGLDQAFIENWIKYANQPQPSDKDQTPAIAHDVRMPSYWSANRATASPELNLKDAATSEGPYFMPRFKGRLSDEEIATIAKYLANLK